MAFFRAYIAPLFIVLIFVVAMVAVSARIFLPSDMMAPAPIETLEQPTQSPEVSLAGDSLPPGISMLLHGQPDHPV
ncbi:hypothetical protein [Pseudanabaena sp. FACHB-2040]|uniref:hypothetical protein n=1 Tax=Pseudanabaena sp. FACHB-2040 TaxID=2692859 RepID=UPI001684E29D|nr:hypothetical protein [Pseudanabaena sp. FACHB-2040]MBD2259692.1 hypothetical protein [Pseudanabaena sp. FACHB-2040]